ncbi:YitT family protein [Brevibacillus sp. HB1.2]|uniref:YitT family protein n=1 Tax=Brevibacillus porteri TaxID=2126350 RepID=A0ABX5FG21_9BACL|nr:MULTISPECIES: YitT family protein [Brevibacillus]ATF15135.1 YitT family protein [Brevibacillus brevis X23]NRS17890.1 YitT family protein [Brevibacillus sp. HB1.4B]NTU23595.1 YitT family protein [Brevibacillus sp. HB1.2]NTU31762.1 YitT family protein [Brevibacillus sp. HB1.1]MDC0762755.1 YitT family protein [Brevibacillus sp. AG]
MARKRRTAIQMNSPQRKILEYGMLVLGSLVLATSFNLFLNPNQIASGGVSGLSTILHNLFGFSPAVVQWAMNIPLFLLGFKLLDRQYSMKAAVGSIVLPLCVMLTSHLQPLTTNLLLASIYGGIGVGLGIGIVFRGRGSTGGFSIASQILHKYSGFSLGACVAVFDGLVILFAGIVFDPEKALYALIALFVTSKTIDIVQMGWNTSKVAYIISNETDTLRETILYDLDRGVTLLDGAGGYTGDARKVLMAVVSQSEVSKLKIMVRSVDPDAFIILCPAQEVLGEGFRAG